MRKPVDQEPASAKDFSRSLPWLLPLVVALVAMLVIRLMNGSRREESRANPAPPNATGGNSKAGAAGAGHARYSPRRTGPTITVESTAEEVLARKIKEFGRSRRELVHALARHFGLEVPDDVERFFEAVESGRWEEIDAAHRALLLDENQLNQPRSAELHKIWRPIQEAWGISREAQHWPAQKILDYGNEVLDSLRPGMVYVGGTDPGAFVPTFLNATSDGERHIVMTQNALADGTYLDYLNFCYGDRLTMVTHDDAERIYQAYLADALKRLQHDQQFPDEPKQLQPDENVRVVDGKPQIWGQVAVMAVNEKLLKLLLEKNPNATFGLEESFSLSSTYTGGAPMGPIIEMRAPEGQNALTAESAGKSVAYWRDLAQQLVSDPETPVGSYARHAYGHMAQAQANLFAANGFYEQAEQAYRVASTFAPDRLFAVEGYSRLLAQQGRTAEAVQLLDSFVRTYPKEQVAVDKLRARLTP